MSTLTAVLVGVALGFAVGFVVGHIRGQWVIYRIVEEGLGHLGRKG